MRVNPRENIETTEILSVLMIQSSLPISFWERISLTLMNVLFFDSILSFTPKITAEENYSETVAKFVQIESSVISQAAE